MSSSSDYNTSGKSPSNVAGAILYSDLDLRMIPNGVGDIAPVTDIDAVKNAVRNLVLSNYHDRPHQPFLGSNIRALLFEPVDSFTASLLKLEIERVLVDHEPRVNAIAVTVTDNSDNNEYKVTINFNVTSLNIASDVNFYLIRLR